MSPMRKKHYYTMTIAVLGLITSAVLSGCSGGGGGGAAFSPQLATLGSVTALYPTNGSKWNDYVQGSSVASATDTLCSAATDTVCLHAGEIRAVTVTGTTSCANLTAADALGTFAWTCDTSTGLARFVSTGLLDGKHLSDLLDFTTPGWKLNRVVIYQSGTAFAATPYTAWWSNPVIADNNGNNGAAMSPGDVYIIQSNPTATYAFGVNNVALVVKPGVLVTGTTATGETLVAANGKDFIWLEGSWNAAGDSIGVFWSSIRFSTLRSVSVSSADTGAQSGVWVEGSTYNRIRDVSTADTLSYGFALVSSPFNDIRKVQCVKDAWLSEILVSSQSNTNYFEDITAVHGRQIGMDVYQSFGNRFVNLVANNNHGRGIVLDLGSSGNVFVNVTVANNSQSGLNLYSPAVNNRFFNVTAANNGNDGLEMFGVPAPGGAQEGYPTNNLFMNMNAVNSNYGFNLSIAADGNQFVNTAAANQDLGIYLNGISNSRFSGLLKVGNLVSNCMVSGGTNPGLVTASCANNGTSNATLRTGIIASASFIGKVAAADTVNGSNTNGAAQFQNITDWLSFSTPLRMWGREGTAAFPHASNAGYCGTSGAAENCRIYDWSLALGDTGDAGTPALMGVLSVPTGAMVFGHTLSTGATVTALLNAVEILDGTGNGDGLCESGETCLYTPNIGAYQGHGNLVSAGPFTAGTITGVTLLKYQFNGR